MATTIDLNLLVVLDALLSESSVVGAANALGLSPSALSRSLARLRVMTGDPLLVRAGRDLVPTPRALELRGKVHALVEDARAVMCPCQELDLRTLKRTFSIRAGEGFVETFAAELLAHASRSAPGIRLRFAPKPNKNVDALRNGDIDLEVGVIGQSGPELRVQALFRDRFIGVVRANHPLATGEITPQRFASFPQIGVSRRGQFDGPIDAMLASLGIKRCVTTVVSSFPTALALARDSDLVASVPERQTEQSRAGMFSFALPMPTEELTVSQIWHPRFDRDPAHRWLRDSLRQVCAARTQDEDCPDAIAT
ncbi:LysR family transcriptional regulator [Burkholderia ubonensis]|uniref:LysR family transcriptional regulator n=1 Tax=Burkholderia ubonensis TaxID=101571 RepID=UPI00075A52B8|nr:LysR family transcriptional regulator [Burkholderia ubonensis]KVP65676.1 LysR family transcriptional regulator [Burkholderia ubonensis]KVU50659.1 LysR family transcriptional regulator [Burkholderia ubonensis]KVU84573.1 LysR family transcriptional regulator [Burkholderia ubonensis]KVV39669.1 LysR family transcriptional regulator [Burkholderia ubonensis]KWB75966.1 LysR family transcriptional regulator [Burkholderia ubonensis]